MKGAVAGTKCGCTPKPSGQKCVCSPLPPSRTVTLTSPALNRMPTLSASGTLGTPAQIMRASVKALRRATAALPRATPHAPMRAKLDGAPGMQQGPGGRQAAIAQVVKLSKHTEAARPAEGPESPNAIPTVVDVVRQLCRLMPRWCDYERLPEPGDQVRPEAACTPSVAGVGQSCRVPDFPPEVGADQGQQMPFVPIHLDVFRPNQTALESGSALDESGSIDQLIRAAPIILSEPGRWRVDPQGRLLLTVGCRDLYSIGPGRAILGNRREYPAPTVDYMLLPVGDVIRQIWSNSNCWSPRPGVSAFCTDIPRPIPLGGLRHANGRDLLFPPDADLLRFGAKVALGRTLETEIVLSVGQAADFGPRQSRRTDGPIADMDGVLFGLGVLMPDWRAEPSRSLGGSNGVAMLGGSATTEYVGAFEAGQPIARGGGFGFVASGSVQSFVASDLAVPRSTQIGYYPPPQQRPGRAPPPSPLLLAGFDPEQQAHIERSFSPSVRRELSDLHAGNHAFTRIELGKWASPCRRLRARVRLRRRSVDAYRLADDVPIRPYDGDGEPSYFDYELSVAIQDGRNRRGPDIAHTFDRNWYQSEYGWVSGDAIDTRKNGLLGVPYTKHPISSVCIVVGGFSNLDSCAENRGLGISFREGFELRVDCVNARWLD